MVDISDFTKQQGEFLKAEHIGEGKKATIIGVAEQTHNEKYDTDRLHIPVSVDDKEFVFDCSKTNARTISDVLGTETSTWVKAILELETYKTKTSDGKMVQAINVSKVLQ